MKKTPLFLVTGFVGSGKTTLLKRVLEGYADTKRVGVIQNEFAQTGTDGTDLRQTGKSFSIVEINNGSVFCVCLLSDFISSLRAFIDEYQPDMVFLEASGMADPIAIAELLHSPQLREKVFLAHSWCIVDVGMFSRLVKMISQARHQVRIADTVVCNKTDIISEGLEEIKKEVARLNPFARVVEATYCQIALQETVENISADIVPVALQRRDEHKSEKSAGRPDIFTGALRSTKKITRDGLNRFLESIAPQAYRVKGYVVHDDGKVSAVQSCFGHTDIRDVEGYVGPTELVFIGKEITPKQFEDRFAEALG